MSDNIKYALLPSPPKTTCPSGETLGAARPLANGIISTPLPSFISEIYSEEQEKLLVRFLLSFGNERLFEIQDEHSGIEYISVAEYIINEILNDELEFRNLLFRKIFEEVNNLLQTGEVIDLKRAVPFRRFNGMVGHRRGKGFGPGRYPKKAAKVILKLLEDCESNAEYSGLNTDSLFIKHIVSHRGRVIHGWMPRAHGRATDWDIHTVNIELILEEREEEDGQ